MARILKEKLQGQGNKNITPDERIMMRETVRDIIEHLKKVIDNNQTLTPQEKKMRRRSMAAELREVDKIIRTDGIVKKVCIAITEKISALTQRIRSFFSFRKAKTPSPDIESKKDLTSQSTQKEKQTERPRF